MFRLLKGAIKHGFSLVGWNILYPMLQTRKGRVAVAQALFDYAKKHPEVVTEFRQVLNTVLAQDMLKNISKSMKTTVAEEGESPIRFDPAASAPAPEETADKFEEVPPVFVGGKLYVDPKRPPRDLAMLKKRLGIDDDRIVYGKPPMPPRIPLPTLPLDMSGSMNDIEPRRSGSRSLSDLKERLGLSRERTPTSEKTEDDDSMPSVDPIEARRTRTPIVPGRGIIREKRRPYVPDYADYSSDEEEDDVEVRFAGTPVTTLRTSAAGASARQEGDTDDTPDGAA